MKTRCWAKVSILLRRPSTEIKYSIIAFGCGYAQIQAISKYVGHFLPIGNWRLNPAKT